MSTWTECKPEKPLSRQARASLELLRIQHQPRTSCPPAFPVCSLHHTKMIFLNFKFCFLLALWIKLQDPDRVNKFLALAELFQLLLLLHSSQMAALQPFQPSFGILCLPYPHLLLFPCSSFSCSFGDLLPGPSFSALHMVQEPFLGLTVPVTMCLVLELA